MLTAAFLSAALVAGSCIEKDRITDNGRAREETLGGSGRLVSGASGTDIGPDTVLLVCGVEPAEGYDWVRDTLAGAYAGKIVLFESTGGKRKGAEYRRILEIEAGPGTRVSAEADMHHLLGGHVYTESSDRLETCFGRDGKELFSFEGRACLRGLLEASDGTVRTLWMDRDGTGICLRAGPDVLFSRDDAVPFGGFYGPDWTRSGGLYERDGRLCFAWSSDIAGKRAYFVWCGDAQTQVFLPVDFDTVDDLKIAGGQVCAVGVKNGATVACFGDKVFTLSARRSMPWFDLSIAEIGGEAFVCGRIGAGRQSCRLVLWSLESNAFAYRGKGSALLHDGKDFAAVAVPDGYFCSVPGGASLCGKRHAVALTPKSGGGGPFVRTESADTGITLEGFLTGVEYTIKEK